MSKVDFKERLRKALEVGAQDKAPLKDVGAQPAGPDPILDPIFKAFHEGSQEGLIVPRLRPGATPEVTPVPEGAQETYETAGPGQEGAKVTIAPPDINWQEDDKFKWGATKPGRANAYQVGTLEPGLAPEDQQLKDWLDNEVLAVKYMQGMAFVKANYGTQRELEGLSFLAAENSKALFEMVDKRFPEFYKKLNAFEEQIDNIRTMKVNPYNYLQQAGPGGRAASVLATAVSQIAAGAGGVNTARAALKNAISRDIEAQQYNIELAYKGLEAGRQNIADQISLLQDEVIFREQGMTFAWQAVETIIAAARLGAQNEAAYIGLGALGYYATLEKLAQKQAANAKMASTIYKIALFNAVDQAKAAKQALNYQQILQQTFHQGMQAGTQQLQQPQAQPQLGTGGASMQGAVQPVAQPIPSATAAPAPPTAAPSVTQRRGGSKRAQAKPAVVAPAQEQYAAPPASIAAPTGGGYSTPMESPAEGEQRTAAQRKKQIEDRSTLKPGEAQALYEARIRSNNPDPNRQHNKLVAGSTSNYVIMKAGSNEPLRNFGDMLDKLMDEDPSKSLSFFSEDNRLRPVDINDAQLMAEILYERRAPLAKTEEELDKLNYIRRYPENLEANVSYKVTNDNNVVKTSANFVTVPGLGTLRLSGTGRYKEGDLKKDAAETGALISDLHKVSKLVKQVGLAKSPFFVVDEEGNWSPKESTFEKNGEAYAALQRLDTAVNDLSIKWIKSRDPSGRLSDQDITLARAMLSAIREKRTFKVLDFADQLFGDGNYDTNDVNAIRAGMELFWKMMAVEAEEEFLNKYPDDIVMSYPAYSQKKDREESIRKFIRTHNKDLKARGRFTTNLSE